MRKHKLVMLLAVCLVLVLSVVLSPYAFARSSTPSLFTVIGGVTEVGSPQDYASADTAFFQVSHMSLKLDNARYYVVHGSPIGSSRPYSYTVIPSGGIQVGVMELGVNQHSNTHLIEVGTLAGASSAVIPYSSGSHAIGYKTV